MTDVFKTETVEILFVPISFSFSVAYDFKAFSTKSNSQQNKPG